MFESQDEAADAVASYLDHYRQGFVDDAYHNLLELDECGYSSLVEAYCASRDKSERAFLLNVIWQYRQASAIPLLAEALFDRDHEIWRAALDGLVAIGGNEARHALLHARHRSFTHRVEGQDFREWLDEAIEQVPHP